MIPQRRQLAGWCAANGRKTIGALFLALASARCDSGAEPIPFENFEDEVRAAGCRHDVRCGSTPDEATCRAASAAGQSPLLVTAPTDLAAGRIHYDGAAARACIDRLDRLACSYTELLGSFQGTYTDCARIFTGTLPIGSACVLDQECLGPALCLKDGAYCFEQCCAGTCTATSATLALGADCSAPAVGLSCVSGAFCGPGPVGGPSRVCKAQLTTAGAACDGVFACAPPLVCQGEPSGPSSCIQPSATGAVCNPTIFRPCDDDRDYCEPTTITCARKGGLGSPCSVDLASCRDDAFCHPFNHVCTAQFNAGQACGGTIEGYCLGDLRCDGSSCMLPPPVASCR